MYRYDGSWEGFLCCVYECVYQRVVPFAILPLDEPCMTLFPEQFVQTDAGRARRVSASFSKKLGFGARELVMQAFLCGEEQKELAILRFLLLGYQVGPRVMAMLGHQDVAPVRRMEQQVTHEAHQFTGFLRFADYGEFLGASITPKSYVLPLLRAHFCQRYPEENFIIYDRTHKAALLYQQHRASYAQLAEPPVFPQVSEAEAGFQALWKQFYKTIAIQARTNPKLRSTHCPKRYWVDMLELWGER